MAEQSGAFTPHWQNHIIKNYLHPGKLYSSGAFLSESSEFTVIGLAKIFLKLFLMLNSLAFGSVLGNLFQTVPLGIPVAEPKAGQMNLFKAVVQKLKSRFQKEDSQGDQEFPPAQNFSADDPGGPPPFPQDFSSPPPGPKVSMSEKTLNFLKRIGSRAASTLPAGGPGAWVPKEFTQNVQRNILQPAFLVDNATRFIQRRGLGAGGILATVLLCAFFLSDITALIFESYLPVSPPPRPVHRQSGMGSSALGSVDAYSIIWTRNLINSRGLLPGEFKKLGFDEEAPAVRSSLPINLVGTLVLKDELKSIATIEDKSNNLIIPVRVQDEIPSKLKILKIESKRVEFVNLNANRKEYIDMPETEGGSPKISLGTSGGSSNAGNSVEKLSPNEFSIARSEIERLTSGNNFTEILTQARAVPNIENGVTTGFRLYQIVPGSIFDKLGLRDGDLICGANGNPVNDIPKVMELVGSLKTLNKLDLCLKREGKQSDYTYNIK